MMDTVELAHDVYETAETNQDKCPIIFLHGCFWNKYMLRELAQELCIRTKRKVYCLDLRCHGESPFTEECSIDLMVADIKRFLKDKHLNKVAFVCHSFSSTMSYLIAIDEPEIVEKLVMVDHPPYTDNTDKNYRENFVPQYLAQKKVLDSLDPGLSLADAKERIIAVSNAATREGKRVFLQKLAYELIQTGNKLGWIKDHESIVKDYRKKFLPTPRGRSNHEILIIRCKDSRIVPDEKFAAVLQYNPNARLVTIRDSTHLLLFEQKEEFLEAVKEFLA